MWQKGIAANYFSEIFCISISVETNCSLVLAAGRCVPWTQDCYPESTECLPFSGWMASYNGWQTKKKKCKNDML